MRDKNKVSRRGFIETAGAATGAMMAAGAFPHPAVGSVKGANEKINIAILGPGGRAQEHLRILLKMKKKEQKPVDIIGLCDVWDGNKESAGTARLYYSAEKCGLDWEGKDKDRVTKDYRKILDYKDVDVVLIATPDHWHAKMSIDAMEAGKDVYCEKPMTHTIDEARRVAETTKKTKQVFTVGVQSTADPRWRMANQMITEGKIGHVMQGQTSYYRNSNERPVALLHARQGHDPQDRRLEDVPRDRVRAGARPAVQPRPVCPVALLLGLRRRHVHRLVRPSAHPPDPGDGRPVAAPGCRRRRIVPGIRWPRRARRGHGGRRLRRRLPGPDLGHDVQRRPASRGDPRPQRDPDVRAEARRRLPHRAPGLPTADPPLRAPIAARAARSSSRSSLAKTPERCGSTSSNALDPATPRRCARRTWVTRRSRRSTWASAPTARARPFTSTRKPASPRDADRAWAARWEERSKLRGKPNQVIGWKAGDTGSLLIPPSYQKLEGDWVDGKDPVETA